MGTIERFKEYLDYKGIANYRAETECGLSNGLIKNALKAGSSLGSDKLEKILSVYSDLSAEWLLRGVGSMIIGGSKATELENKISSMSNSQERKEQAYDILLGMFDVMSKTYDYFGREG
ncbi:MAG: hypothetical protein IJ588_13680 [Prevotella sp.]|nr:hypothetical protein [Prevotella sp.]